MDRGDVQVSPPTCRSRATEEHVRNMFFVYHLGDRGSDGLALHTYNRCTHIFGKLEVVTKSSLIPLGRVLTHVDVNDEKFAIQSLRHARATRDQMLGSRIGTHAHRDTLAHSQVPACLLLVEIGFEIAVDRMRHL